MEDYERYQDVLGQLIFLKTYTHIVLAFPSQHDVSQTTIVQELERAARLLTATFPWLSGHVVREGSSPGVTGLTKIVPYLPGERESIVTVKDCTSLLPSLDEILAAGGPMAMLDGALLSSRKGLPESYDETVEPAPVLAAQVSFVKGGMLLGFAGQHNIMDMNGMAQAIRLFAKALRGEPFTEAEIEQGNRDKRDVIRLLGPEEQKEDLSSFHVPQKPQAPEGQAPPDLRWVYFHFSGTSLAKLKALVTKVTETDASMKDLWVSTDDVLSAFISQHILSSRIHRLGKPPNATATICRAINCRRFLETSLPREYMGHMVYCISTPVPLDSPAATSDLGALARSLRTALQTLRPAAIQSFATGLHESPDKGALSYGATLDFSKYDLMLSSWSGLELFQTDFGKVLGGRPVLAKRQRFAPMESLMYFMPRTDAGDVDVAACLRVEDIDSLKEDAEFMQYADYVG
ncbi:Trichothecene 3-O-acetyltransferase [Pleurostoma richardsiae]|uniref:Trichothecene 3-O-acetyltransferase n=1 Tax=Pleurostoma richardsiae TaxID=41990 RepID=A0AA38R423_9PEZI|nr:Trichothecene 3-O-acetyltransferase [Pleurostoma richardsiae]